MTDKYFILGDSLDWMIDLIVHIHKYGDIKVNGTNTITISIIEKKRSIEAKKSRFQNLLASKAYEY